MITSDRVREIVSTTLNVPLDIVTETLSMEDISQWDSMGNMAIIAALEEQFGVEIPIEDLFELTSIPAIVAEIDKLTR